MEKIEKSKFVVSFLRSEAEASTEALEKRVEPILDFFERERISLSIDRYELNTILVHRSGTRGVGSRNHGNGTLYEAPFAEAIFSVVFRRDQESAGDGRADRSMLPYVYRKWCECPPAPDLWLSRGADQYLFEGIQPKNLHEKVNIEQISFGIVLNLSLFCPEDKIDCKQPIAEGLTEPAVTVQASFDHVHKYLKILLTKIHVCDDFKGSKSTFKLEIEYSSVARVIVDVRTLHTDLYIRLKSPALLYSSHSNERSQKFNRCSLLGCTSPKCKLKIFCRRLGGTNTVKLRWKNAQGLLLTLHTFFCKLRQSETFVASMTTIEKPKTGIRQVNHLMKQFFDDDSIAFRAKYALEACKLISFDLIRQIAVESIEEAQSFFKLLKEMATYKGTHKLFEKTMFHLLKAVDEGNVVVYKNGIVSQFHEFKAQERHKRIRAEVGDDDEDKLPQGMAIVYKVFLTPSRTILRPPEEHGENRVLRQVDLDYVLRLAFRDDHLESLTYSLRGKPGRAFLDSTIKEFLRGGICLANRKYEYLAASSSQLREHGCWFYAEDQQGRTSQSIRNEMGIFDRIENVGKKMAREGQCFSSTIETVKVSEDEFTRIEDIVGGEHKVSLKPYIFSDGVGKISAELRDDVCKALETTLKGKKPSAFQIRFRGAKGMVALDPSLKGRQLVLRESMVKFECPYASSWSFEVVKYSEERSTTLNKQIITILEQLGVPASVFIQYQEANIIDFTDALIFENVACSRLIASIKQDTDCFIDYSKFREFGMSILKDPYFRSALIVLFKNIITNLRSKARIAIPWNLGRNLLGVMDETGLLEYGQVYIRYTVKEDFSSPDYQEEKNDTSNSSDSPIVDANLVDAPEAKTAVVNGKVVVTKCPCLHPGDVRMLEAVDVPELAHLVDVIVFPQKGPRPHPNEMAGSDLDGDEYAVIWDPQFYFTCRCSECKRNPRPDGNHEPMTFDDKPAKKKENITLEDYYEFICEFIITDQKGKISNAHLAHADRKPDGIFSRECLNLAVKTSTCLDFAKTGRADDLEPSEKVKTYPDFMEKQDHKPTYYSERVLGRLYRACRSLEHTISMGFVGPSEKYVHKKFEVPGWEKMKSLAIQYTKKYEERLIKIMNHMGIKSEAEIMVGIVQQVGKYQSKSFYDIEELQQQLERQHAFLSGKMKEDFLRLAGGNRDNQFRLASACYMVVYDAPEGQEITRFYGAPWILFEYLMDCSELNDDGIRSISNCPIASAINDAMMKKFDVTMSRKNKVMLVLKDWAEAEGLGMTQKISICNRCLFSMFQKSRASFHEVEVNSSMGTDVLLFIRYCALKLESKARSVDCKDDCSMGRNEELIFQKIAMAAMRTYSSLAVSGDICTIAGLSCGKPHKVQKSWSGKQSHLIVLDIDDTFSISLLSDHKKSIEKILREWCDADKDDRIAFNFEDSNGNRQIELIIEAQEWTSYSLENQLFELRLENALISKLKDELIKRGEYKYSTLRVDRNLRS